MKPTGAAKKLVHPTRFERVAFAFGGQRSIQLSYGCVGRSAISFVAVGQEQRECLLRIISAFISLPSVMAAFRTRWTRAKAILLTKGPMALGHTLQSSSLEPIHCANRKGGPISRAAFSDFICRSKTPERLMPLRGCRDAQQYERAYRCGRADSTASHGAQRHDGRQ